MAVLESLSQSPGLVRPGGRAGGPTAGELRGASAELDALGEELTQVVRLIDGLNRYRFADTELAGRGGERQQGGRAAAL